MAVFNNVTVTDSDWVDINTLSGVPVGATFNIQNISSANIILVESSTKPVVDNGPILFNSFMYDLSKAVVGAGSQKMWAKVIGKPTMAILAVFE